MLRMNDIDLLNIVRTILLENDTSPVMSSEDIRKILQTNYDIHYNDNRYFSKKLSNAVRNNRDQIITSAYVGNTTVYFLEDWKNAYFNNR